MPNVILFILLFVTAAIFCAPKAYPQARTSPENQAAEQDAAAGPESLHPQTSDTLSQAHTQNPSKSLTILGFTGGEDQLTAEELAETAGFDTADCPKWRMQGPLQTSCFERNRREKLALSYREGLVSGIDYDFEIARFNDVRSDLIRQFGIPKAFIDPRGNSWVYDFWRQGDYRKVEVDISKRTDGAAHVSLIATQLVDDLITAANTRESGSTFGTALAGAEAQYHLGTMFLDGNRWHPKDDRRAVYWFRKAAEQGLAAAQSDLAVMYQLGRGGLAADAVEALVWIKKAAAQGYAPSEASLGFFCQSGKGGQPIDGVQAAYWYRKSAEQGYAGGEHDLGVMYHQGLGGLPQDDVQAVYWYRKAAEKGYASSQLNLALMYEEGHGGLAKDIRKAQVWYCKAAEQGDAAAVRKLAKLNLIAALPQEQFAEELTSKTSGEAWWCAGGQHGEILAGYYMTRYLSAKTGDQLAIGSPMFLDAFRKGFRFMAIRDRDYTIKTVALSPQGPMLRGVDALSDVDQRYLTRALMVLSAVAEDVDGTRGTRGRFHIRLEGKEITACIPALTPRACSRGQVGDDDGRCIDGF